MKEKRKKLELRGRRIGLVLVIMQMRNHGRDSWKTKKMRTDQSSRSTVALKVKSFLRPNA